MATKWQYNGIMKKGKRQPHDKAIKDIALQLAEKGEKISNISRWLNVPERTIREWRGVDK